MAVSNQFSLSSVPSFTFVWPRLSCLLWNGCSRCCVRGAKFSMQHITVSARCHLNVHTLSQCHGPLHSIPWREGQEVRGNTALNTEESFCAAVAQSSQSPQEPLLRFESNLRFWEQKLCQAGIPASRLIKLKGKSIAVGLPSNQWDPFTRLREEMSVISSFTGRECNVVLSLQWCVPPLWDFRSSSLFLKLKYFTAKTKF